MPYPARSDFAAAVADGGWWLALRKIDGRDVATVCAAAGRTFTRAVQQALAANAPAGLGALGVDGAWGNATMVHLSSYLERHRAPSALRAAVQRGWDANRISAEVVHAGIWVFEHVAVRRSGEPMPEIYLPPDVVPPRWEQAPPAPPGWRATDPVGCSALGPGEPRPASWPQDPLPVEPPPPRYNLPTYDTLPSGPTGDGNLYLDDSHALDGATTTTTTTGSGPFGGSWNPLDYESPSVSPGAPTAQTRPLPPAPPDSQWVDTWFGGPVPPPSAPVPSSTPGAPAEQRPPAPTVGVLERTPVAASTTAAPVVLPEGYLSKTGGETTRPTAVLFGMPWYVPVGIGAVLLVGLTAALVASGAGAGPAPALRGPPAPPPRAPAKRRTPEKPARANPAARRRRARR